MKKVGASIIEETLYVNEAIRAVIVRKFQPAKRASKEEKTFYKHKMEQSIKYLLNNEK